MLRNVKKSRRPSDARVSKLRLESLEERQLLTAVGWEAAATSDQVPYGPEFHALCDERCEPAVDLTAVQDADATPRDLIENYSFLKTTEDKSFLTVTSIDDPEELTPGTLRYAIENADEGDTITFADSLKDAAIKLNGTELVVDKAITIDASSLYDKTTNTPGITINADGKSRVATISAGTTETPVVFNGLTFQNGCDEKGGAIKNSGTLTLNGVTFQDNVATKNGGAIFNDVGATLTVNGGTYERNSARNGGAFANYGAMTISDMTISETDDPSSISSSSVGAFILNNSADLFGGAYFGCGSLTISGFGTYFADNTAGWGDEIDVGAKGGAIYNDVYGDLKGVVSITGDVVFNSNKAGGRGGAIQSYSTLTVEGSASFNDNGSTFYGGAIDVGEGCVATLGGYLTLTENTANFGGAIFSVGALEFKPYGIYVFEENTASYGSGVAIDACDGILTLAGGEFTFSLNEAREGEYDEIDAETGVGGAIATAAETTVADGTTFTFEGNVAARGADVAVDTTEEGNEANAVNAEPAKFGSDVDYATIAVVRDTVPSPSAPLNLNKFTPNAKSGTITVAGATASFGEDGVSPQQLGLGAGTYEALVQCADANGQTCAVYSLVLTVDAGASLEVRETSIANGRGVKFDFNLTKEDGRAVSVWEISWDDGSTSRFENLSRSQTAAHYYAQDGAFDVSLKVVYLDGLSETFESFSTQKIGATSESDARGNFRNFRRLVRQVGLRSRLGRVRFLVFFHKRGVAFCGAASISK